MPQGARSSPVGNPDTHLSRASQSQDSGGVRCGGGMVAGVGMQLADLWGFTGWGVTQDVPQGASI